jgi:aminoglycoside 6'-N-acetyltransferase
LALHLETKRLILRSFRDSDLNAFSAYRSDPAVAKYQGWDAPYSLEAAAAFIQEMKERQPGTTGEWYQIAVELRDGGALIGDCAFHILARDGQQAEIGFTFAAPHQKKGYATEAVARLLEYLFGDLSMRRVSATCDAENLASARLLERIGMRREAHLIENIWFKGAWGSEYTYALLKKEWEQNKEAWRAA